VRKLLVVIGFTLLLAATAVADQINFNFTVGSPTSVTATSAGGLSSGPSTLTSISDSTTSVIIPTAGTYVNGNTGPAVSLMQFGTVVLGTFMGAGPNSVLVVDSSNNVLVAGSMNDSASLLSTVPAGTGSFLGTFHVTFVSPAALALFGVGPGFSPNGSVALTIGNASFNGTTYKGAIGGGSVTIQSTAAVPEPMGLGILGIGLLTIGGLWRRWHHN
jgi:hypothetical protein